MSKLKTRTNQPVIGSADVLDYIEQNGTTTEVGGNMEVDGNLKVNGSLTDADGNPIGGDPRALLLPVDAPTEQELVGIDTANAQNRITIGDGLTVDNGSITLKNTYISYGGVKSERFGLNNSPNGEATFGISPLGVGYCLVVNSADGDYTTVEHTAGSKISFSIAPALNNSLFNNIKAKSMIMMPNGTERVYIASQTMLINGQYLAQANIHKTVFSPTASYINCEIVFIDTIPANSIIKFMITGFIPSTIA